MNEPQDAGGLVLILAIAGTVVGTIIVLLFAFMKKNRKK